MMRSAWIKWARAVEHQRLLARQGREFAVSGGVYEYVRTDNASDSSDPLLRMHWRLKLKQHYPESWSVLIGDVLTNLRAALDHTFWAAVLAHTGQPAQPHRVTFPIHTQENKFAKAAAELKSLVADDVWDVIDVVQPFHGDADAYTSPLEVLRWLSNVDKHRAVHVVGSTVVDFAPIHMEVDPQDVVEQYRYEGPAEDGTVVARLKINRPSSSQGLELLPTFAYSPSVQISESPADFRSLHSAMEVMREDVLNVLYAVGERLGAPASDHEGLELGEHHEAYLSDLAGVVASYHEHDGTVHQLSLDHPADGRQDG